MQALLDLGWDKVILSFEPPLAAPLSSLSADDENVPPHLYARSSQNDKLDGDLVSAQSLPTPYVGGRIAYVSSI